MPQEQTFTPYFPGKCLPALPLTWNLPHYSSRSFHPKLLEKANFPPAVIGITPYPITTLRCAFVWPVPRLYFRELRTATAHLLNICVFTFCKHTMWEAGDWHAHYTVCLADHFLCSGYCLPGSIYQAHMKEGPESRWCLHAFSNFFPFPQVSLPRTSLILMVTGSPVCQFRPRQF